MVVLRKPQAFGCLRTLCVAGLLTALAASVGCETGAGTGAAAGGLLGAGIGGLVGHCPGAALAGGALGAGAGLVGGGIADAVHEKKAQKAAVTQAAVRAPSLEEIVRMTQSAVPPQQIIDQIRTSGFPYQLTSDQVIWLNQQGVNPAVITELQASANRPPPGRVVYRAAPVVQPVYVYGPPPPPVAVGVGVGLR
ncbi:MAG TPA: hypothetical protein VH682_08790 [Gemmataceae bacterium]|jgi:hypothetical protein